MNNSPSPLTLRNIVTSLRYLLFLLLFCSVSFSLSANNNTDPVRLQYSQFDQFIQQQQGQQALQIVQQMMQSAPSHPLTGVAQARINLIRNNLAEAQLILNQVLNAYPHQPEATAFLAELENYQGQKQNALRRIDLALQQHPDADLLASMALRILAQPQDAQQRIPYLQRLANSGSDAERAQAYASIGETYMTLKQASAAADALRQSLELQLNANVAYAFVQQLVVAGRYGEALAYAALLRADFPQAQANALEQAWAAELQQALAAMTRTVAPVPNVSKVSAADRTELESIINQVTVQPR